MIFIVFFAFLSGLRSYSVGHSSEVIVFGGKARKKETARKTKKEVAGGSFKLAAS
jgi:hypothetical protein